MTFRYFLRNTILLWGCISALFVLGTGCMRTPLTGQPGGPAPAVVGVWHSLEGAESDALQAQVQTIMQTHPEVIINLQYVPEDNFAAYSYLAEAGGEGPEIFIASKEIIRELYANGALAKAAYSDQEAFPAASSVFQYGEAAYASPWLTDVPLLYFRTDMADLPVNLDDLFSKGGISVAAPDMASLSAWWSGQGGQLVKEGAPSLDDPNNVAFLKQLKYWQGTKRLRIDPDVLAAFADGGPPYMIAGASQAKFLSLQNIPWGCMQPVELIGGQGNPLLGKTLGIANSAVKTNEVMLPAIQLVEKALLTPEVEGAMLQAGGLLPANQEYYQSSEAQKGVFPQANQALTTAWSLAGNALERKLIPFQDAAWSKVVAGKATPEDALAVAQREAINALAAK